MQKKIFFVLSLLLLNSSSFALTPGFTPVPSLTGSISLRSSSTVEEKGKALDRLALDFFSQKQNQRAQALQAQEEMIKQMSRSNSSLTPITPTPRVKVDPLKTFNQVLKSFGLVSEPKKLLPATKLPEARLAVGVTLENLDQAINQAIDLLPTDAQIQAGIVLSPEQVTLAGKIVNALAVQTVRPLGFRLHAPSCGNVIFKYTQDNGQEASALSDYFSHIPYKDTRSAPTDHEQKAVEALVKVQQGIRCMSNLDFSSVDASTSSAFLDLYYRLLRSGRSQVARALIDNSLPLVIVLFDAAKYFQIPQVSRVFCLPRDLSRPEANITAIGTAPWQLEPNNRYGALKIGSYTYSPSLGASFGGSCDLSLMQLLLEDAQNAPRSTLQTFGIWAEDPFRLDHPLNQLSRRALSPFQFVEHLVDFRNWGEGDCSMLEWANAGGLCRSMRTCQMMREINNTLAGLGGLRLGSGSSFQIGSGHSIGGARGGSGAPAPSASRTAPDGAAGSPNTLFGVPRSSVGNHCGGSGGGGGGGGGQSGCGMPTGSQRLFSTNPEMNHLMQCAVQSVSGPFQAQTDLTRSPVCRLNLSSDEDNQNDSHQNRTQQERTEEERREANRREAAERIRRESNDLANRLYAELTRRGYEVRGGVATVRSAIESRIGLVENAEFGDIVESEDAWGLFDESRGGGVIVFDSAHALGGGEEFYVTAVHELLHATLEYMGWQGYTETTSDGVVTRATTLPALDHRTSGDREEHSIIRRLGYEQCDPDSNSCSNSCSYSDMRLTRFKDCVSQSTNQGASIQSIWCRITPDACGDGRGADSASAGRVGDGCFGTLDLSPECLLVSCDSEGSSVPGCCSAGGGSGVAGGSGGAPLPGATLRDRICASSPDRCGDRRGGGGDPIIPGGGSGPIPGNPGGPEGGEEGNPIP